MDSSIMWLKSIYLLMYFLFLSVISPAVAAHEFWIEPEQYFVDTKSMIKASLRIGDDFEGSTVVYHKSNTNRFDLVNQGRSEEINPRLGDDPALAVQAQQSGLHVVVHQSGISTLSYTKWEKFKSFADNKDFKNIQKRHQARGLADKHFVEAYCRYSKSLIAVGDGAGNDQQNGLEIELVALQNPYTSDLSDGIKVAGYYQGRTQANTQIELFEKSPQGEVKASRLRTNDLGVVVLPVKPNHQYLVDMVVLREPSETLTKDKRAVWETVWASLTFATKHSAGE